MKSSKKKEICKLMKMNDIKNEVINLYVKGIEFPARFSKKAIFRWFFR